MEFSKRLKKLREEVGLSQEELAEKLNIPRSSVSHYEGEHARLPRQKRLNEIADFFGVSVDYLIGRANTKKLTEDEKDFIKDSKELTIGELQKEYKITIDGKTATKEEIEGAIAFIRSLRGLK